MTHPPPYAEVFDTLFRLGGSADPAQLRLLADRVAYALPHGCSRAAHAARLTARLLRQVATAEETIARADRALQTEEALL